MSKLDIMFTLFIIWELGLFFVSIRATYKRYPILDMFCIIFMVVSFIVVIHLVSSFSL